MASTKMKYDHVTSIDLDESSKLLIKVVFRPHLMEVLEYLASNYELSVFTAGEQMYADAVLDCIDPNKEYISHRLYRQHCTKRDNYYIKDLRVI